MSTYDAGIVMDMICHVRCLFRQHTYTYFRPHRTATHRTRIRFAFVLHDSEIPANKATSEISSETEFGSSRDTTTQSLVLLLISFQGLRTYVASAFHLPASL